MSSGIRMTVENAYDQELLKKLQIRFEVQSVKRVFWILEKTPGFLEAKDLYNKFSEVFYDSIAEKMELGFSQMSSANSYAEVRFHPGVTDNLARTAIEALQVLTPEIDCGWLDYPVSVHSGWQVEMNGDISKNSAQAQKIQKSIEELLANPLLYTTSIASGSDVLNKNVWARFDSYWSSASRLQPEVMMIPLKFDAMEKLNLERGLALSKVEIDAILSEFSPRKGEWAGFITDVELECIAQSWSEHCKHKIFAANIDYSEENVPLGLKKLGAIKVSSLYKEYIQKSTKELQSDCNYLVSVFKDNSGVVDFDPNLNVCIKVETHNSPSALDPFGGALTGILGVNRDILGTGCGAKPIANTDIFCLSYDKIFPTENSPERPVGLHSPNFIRTGVHAGVEEGGNQSGIPTVNGSFRFDKNYSGKPLVFVGSIGVMPKVVNGKPSHEKTIQSGDFIVVTGGRLGKDGVHGATFSSLSLTEGVPASVVQIGDAITQKRVIDFTLLARDRGYIRTLTDNGAGGVSSSIGELAQLTNGAQIDLSKHGVKYAGLEFWEMLVSESQERMSYAVAPEKLETFKSLAHQMGVEVFVLGNFNSSGLFDVRYKEKQLALIGLEFLHESVPKMQLKAHFMPTLNISENSVKPSGRIELQKISKTLSLILADPNVASKEDFVRSYDHEVQGATLGKPFTGKTQMGPSDAGVLDMQVHGGGAINAVGISHGICPQYSNYDTYYMTQKAVDEAVRNLVCTGVDPKKMALVDNFCWPDPLSSKTNPDAEHKLAQLVRSCAGLYEAAKIFKTPFISGKDSMKNDFVGVTKSGSNIKISVPPTLLITAMGAIHDKTRIVQSAFKNAGDVIYLIGDVSNSLYASVYSEIYKDTIQTAPEPLSLENNRQLYQDLWSAIQSRELASAHDISDGGLLVAIAESCFGNTLGCKLDFTNMNWNQLWSEVGTGIVVSIPKNKKADFEKRFGPRAKHLGEVISDFKWQMQSDLVTEEIALSPLLQSWRYGMREV